VSPAVAAVVVTHGPDPDLGACLRALSTQVDELVVVDNLNVSLDGLPPDARVVVNDRPMGFSANANRGIAQTTAPYVAIVNPDAIARPDTVEVLVRFADAHPRCGIAGPQLRYPDGRWQASRRRFPTVWGTIVRRTPLRLVLDPERFSRQHYVLDERPVEPVPADWMLGGFLLLRREMLDDLDGFDEGFRLYGEDIDLCYRAAKTGWERWYVPAAVASHRLEELTARRFFTRRTIWHWRGMLRFVRKHPERLKALR
jgi:GT2 family glycosyltransferase